MMIVKELEPRLKGEPTVVAVKDHKADRDFVYKFSVDGKELTIEELEMDNGNVVEGTNVPDKVVEKLLTEEDYNRVYGADGDLIGQLKIGDFTEDQTTDN